MVDTVRVKPWPGLILAGIPRSGAEIPRALAEEWTANHLVLPIPQPVPQGRPTKPAPNARKRRRTR